MYLIISKFYYQQTNSTNSTSVEEGVAVTENNVYVTASGAESTNSLYSSPDTFIKSSNDNGQTFGEHINLSNSTGIKSTRAEIKASGDNVFVAWWDKTDGKDQPMMRISHDGGQPRQGNYANSNFYLIILDGL